MSIRQEIEVLPGDPTVDYTDVVVRTPRNKMREKRLRLGWTVKETIGIAVVNPRGVAAGKKSVIVGDGDGYQ